MPTEARVERDPETGKILRVISNTPKRENPLNDPLLSEDEEDKDQDIEEGHREGREIISQLEEQASMIPEKRMRKQSQREREWIQRLVEQYGDDTKMMARDMKLNPMQQTEADIARRIKKWRSEGGTVGWVEYVTDTNQHMNSSFAVGKHHCCQIIWSS